ncbi:MAG: nucleotidyltransferase domain-containing protein [Phycisphaerales bacterium]|nr:nucleotidyltransferase domain-containing protein [Phycisphaerales bacterium]
MKAAVDPLEIPFRAPVDDALIARLVERILETRPCTCIVLFGSQAYGQPTADSDVDLLIVSEGAEETFKVAAELYYALSPRDFGIDLVVMTPATFHERRKKFDPFFQEITTKGHVLYGALP